ncbi:hypothetical protein [Bradyrhizobium sp. STM 3562]|uniref:hypothetical protein n=1 Tax=Bradyrhizobium sp. STM 3562 TaxID=578924 RepID=UPI00388DA323
MWTRLAGIVLFVAGGIAQAQSASENAPTLESCFQNVRVADAICSKLSDPEQRVSCSVTAQKVELECLERVLAVAPAGRKGPAVPSDTAQSTPSSATALPTASSVGGERETAPVDSTASIPVGRSAARPDGAAKSPPPSSLSSLAEAPSTSIRSDASSKDEQLPGKSNWIVSETTSPVDFGPLVTAVLHSGSGAKDSGDTLSIRCSSHHAEVSLRMDRAWTVRPNDKLPVDYQINDQSPVRQQWAVSADGKTAVYKGDAIAFLQSIPEGATMRVSLTDKGIRPEAVFHLTGLSVIRQKIVAACEHTPVTARTSFGTR